MQLEAQAFWLPKSGNTAEEYEDAVAYSPDQNLFAIADGASESSFADRWAQILVREFAASPPANLTSEAEWIEWLTPLRHEWHDGIPWDVLPWYAEEKARQGAHATLLGLAVLPAVPTAFQRFLRKAAFWKSGDDHLPVRPYTAVTVGDSCLFQIRGNELLESFPLKRSQEFTARPFLVGSGLEEENPARLFPPRLMKGSLSPGDTLLLVTDALAFWLLERFESGARPWELLQKVDSQKNFTLLVGQLRKGKTLKNDDTTLLRLHWPTIRTSNLMGSRPQKGISP